MYLRITKNYYEGLKTILLLLYMHPSAASIILVNNFYTDRSLGLVTSIVRVKSKCVSIHSPTFMEHIKGRKQPGAVGPELRIGWYRD